MPNTLLKICLGAALAIGLAGTTLAQPTTAPTVPAAAVDAPEPAGPPAGFVAPAEPQPDDSAAARNRSQPGNNAPIWRQVRDSGSQPGVSNIGGVEGGMLIQPFVQYPGVKATTAGEAWRQVRNRWIIPYGGALIVIAIVALALMYFAKGPIKTHTPATGRRIERFTPLERAAHWVNAIAFTVLAVSGIVMAFGKFLLLPILGGTLFGGLTYVLKTAHNFAGPLFMVSLVIVILTFVKDNFPRAGDWRWLKSFGGMFGGEEVPSHRFNAGEKALFWLGVLGLGLTVSISGLFLNQIVPGMDNTRGEMQIAHMVHAVSAALMIAMFLGHIYMGTIGTEGAYRAMRHGTVDEAWAMDHHRLWYEDVKAGRIPAQRSTVDDAVPGPGRAAGAKA